MKKSLVALVLALCVLFTMLAVPAVAEEKPAGWNNVNAEGYVYPDYTGEKIRFMWWGSDTRAKITTEVIEMYEKLTGLDIEYEFYDGTTYWTVFQAYQAANDLPDMFQMGNNWLTYYETIEPLNSYIESGVIDTTAISPAMLNKALKDNVKDTFNMVSVDGDTSTNDMVSIMANGMAGNALIDAEGADYDAFAAALNEVTTYLCRMIARDGEGASHLLTCKVSGGKTVRDAKLAAKSVVCSSLLKAAIFGADANWGRVLCALGYSGADIDVWKVDVSFRSVKGEIQVCSMGASLDFSEEKAKEILLEEEVEVLVTLRDGDASATAWGCDLTYDYVKINGDYRT